MTTPPMGPQPTPPQQYPSAQPQQQPKAGIFDLRFTQFLSLTLISVWWTVALVIIGLMAIVGVISGITRLSGSPATGLAYIFGSLLGSVLLAVLTRLFLESVAVLFRIAENTSAIARQGRTSG